MSESKQAAVAQNVKKLNAVPRVMRLEQLESRVLYSADAAPLLALVDPFDESVFGEQPPERALWKSIEDQSDTRYLGTFESSSINVITEVVIVDSTQPDTAELQTLLQSQLEDGDRIAIVTLDATDDPIASIAEILSRYSDLQAVHIVSHATDGALRLGNQSISQSNLLDDSATIQQWGEALHADGDILLYGCNLSATDDGRLFAKTLSTLTDADVASSNDITGHALENGDWDLEVVEGEIETDVVVQAQVQDDWTGSLDYTAGLLHHWKLDGNGDDSVGTSDANYINAVGSPTGLINQAGDFFESSSVLKFGEIPSYQINPLGTADFTISFWMHVNSADDGDQMFGNRQGNSSGYAISLDAAGNVVFEMSDGATVQSVTSNHSVTDSDWRFVTVRRTDGYLVLDIYNRASGFSHNMTANHAGVISVGNQFPTRMGLESTSAGDYDGLLDDIRIYDHYISGARIDDIIGDVAGFAEEQLVINNAVTVPHSGSTLTLVPNTHLLTTDADTSASDLVYTITAASDAAAFYNNGVQLDSGDTFTQADINSFRISVGSLGHPIATSGSIGISVDDGQGTVTTDYFRVNIDFSSTTTNEAPSLSDSVMSSFDEDTPPPLITVFDIFNPQFTDPDSGGSLSGVAISANDDTSANGQWQFSDDGITWEPLGIVSSSNALVIAQDDYLRFLPATHYNGSAPSLGVHAIDDSYTGGYSQSGSPIYVDASIVDSTSAVSQSQAALDVTVDAVNDPPFNLDSNQSALRVDEDAVGGTVLGLMTADDIEGDTLTFNLVTNAGNRIEVHPTTGVVTVKPGASLDYEMNTFHQITVEVDDGNGGTFTDQFPIHVEDVNDAPTLVTASLADVQEDDTDPAGEVISDVLTTAFDDEDAGDNVSAIAIIDNPAAKGIWQFSFDGGGSWLNVGTVSASSALMLSAANEIRFVPTAGYIGPASPLTIYALDSTYTGLVTTGTGVVIADVATDLNGTFLSETSADITVQVLPVNDPAVLSLGSLVASLPEDTATTVAIDVANIYITDVDGGTNTLSLTGADASFFQITGSLLQLTPGVTLDADTQSLLQVDVNVDDTGVPGTPDDSVTFTMQVTDVNEPPELASIETTNLFYFENATPITISSSLVVTEQDNNLIESATVQISSGFATGEDELLFIDQSGIAGSFDVATGILSLSGQASTLAYQNALRTITFHNTSDNPTTGARIIQFTVQDDLFTSNTVSRIVGVQASNDAPTVQLLGLQSFIDENTVVSTALAVADIVVSDVDAGVNTLNLSGAHASLFQITGNHLELKPGVTLDAETLAQLDVTVNVDDIQVGPGNDDSANFTLLVNDIDEPPVLSGIEAGVLTYTEGGAPVPISSTINVAEPDTGFINSATIQFSSGYISGEDQLNFATIGSVTGSFDSTTGVLTLSGSGGVAVYESAIRSVTYSNLSSNPDWAPRTIDIQVSDGVNVSNVESRPIGVSVVNNAPNVQLSPLVTSIVENTFVSTALDVADIAVTDVDAGTNTLSLSGAHASLFQIVGNKLQLLPGVALDTETLAQLDVTVNVDDALIGAGVEDSDNYTLLVDNVDEPPVISAIEPAVLTYVENGTPVPISSSIVVAEPDNGLIDSATVQFSAGFVAGADQLAFAPQGSIVGSFNSTTGLLTLSGQATAADYQTAIQSVTYSNLSNNPAAATRTIDIQVNDGVYVSNIESRTIAVTATNDAPNIQLTPLVMSLDENTVVSSPLDVANIVVTDIDSGLNTLSLSGTHASLFQITGNKLQLLPGVSLDTESLAQLDVTVNVDDASIGIGVEDSDNYTLLVDNVDEPPVISALEPAVLTYVENGTPVPISSSIVVAEPDNGLIGSATVQFSAGFVAGADQLAFTSQNNIAGSFNSTTGLLTLSGQASAADYQSAIQSVTYSNLSNNPAGTTRTIEIQVNDGANVSNIESRAITVTATNDAPSVQLSPLVMSLDENTAVPSALDVANIVVTDVDGGVNTLSLSGAHATLFQIVGNKLQLLPGVTLNTETLAQLDVTVNVDDASIGTGIEDSDNYTLLVDNVDEPPVLSATESTVLTYVENGTPVPVSSTIVVAEPDNGLIDSATVQFSSGYVAGADQLTFVNQNGIVGSFDVATGLLILSGQASAVDYQIAIQSITYNNLSDNPAGTARTIDIQVDDGANGSNVESRTIAVTAINDAPSVQLNPLMSSLDENTVVSSLMDVANIVITDIDGGANTLSLSGAHASLFQIAGNKLQLLPGITLDAETLAQLDVTVNVDDTSIGAGIEDSDNYALQINGLNEPPLLSAIEASTLSYTENGVPVAMSSTIVVAEPDNGQISSAQIQLVGYQAGADNLNFTDQNGIAAQFDSVTGVLSLTGQASAADYQTAIRSVSYSNVSDAPATAVRKIDVFVNDGVNDSNTLSRIVTVLPVADAPALTLTNVISSIPENTPTTAPITVADINVVDPDNGPNTLSLSGADANLFQISANQLQLKPGVSLDAEAIAQLDVTVQVDDATIGTGIEDSVSYSLMVSDANEAPLLATIESSAAMYVEDSAPVIVSSSIEVGEPDNGLISSAEIKIITGFDATTDQLYFTDQNGITGTFDSASGVLTMTGVATAQQYQDAIQSVSYAFTGDNPSMTRTLQFSVSDGVHESNSLSRVISLIAVNDEEQLHQNMDMEIKLNEKLVLSNAMLEVLDADQSTSQLVYTPVGALQHAQLLVAGLPAPSFTQADINQGLVSLDFSGAEPGSHLLPFSVDDGSGSATTFNFSITINDEPAPALGAAAPQPITAIPDLVLSIEPATDWAELLSTNTTTQETTVASSAQTENQEPDSAQTTVGETQNATTEESSTAESNTAIPSLGEASLSALNIPDFASATTRIASLTTSDSFIAATNTLQGKLTISDALRSELQVTSLLSLEPLSVNDTSAFESQSDNVGLIKSLEKLQEELAKASDKIEGKAVARDTVVGFSLSVTAGFLIWMLRGGALLASMFSIAPLWKQLDPLPILSNTGEDDENGESDDKVETLFRGK